jgi:hypothetical protein
VVEQSRSRPPDDASVCLFGAEALARHRNGGDVVVDVVPQDLERNAPAVDLVAHDELGTIVAEHTMVPVYAEQVAHVVRAEKLFTGFSERFGHGLPAPGRYTLQIDPAGLDVPRPARDEHLRQLEAWVRDQDPVYREDIACPTIEAGPPDVWLPVKLYRRRCMPEDVGSLTLQVVRLDKAAVQRQEMLTRALSTHCPKLQTEKERHPGAVSLLVLGTHDLQMGNPWELMRATFSVAQVLEDQGLIVIPDAIIWVETLPGDGHWDAYVAKCGAWSAVVTSDPPARRPAPPFSLRMRRLSPR